MSSVTELLTTLSEGNDKCDGNNSCNGCDRCNGNDSCNGCDGNDRCNRCNGNNRCNSNDTIPINTKVNKHIPIIKDKSIVTNYSKIKVLLTMNIGYKGRYYLPRTLKSIFGEIQVENPNIKNIIYYYTGEYKLFNLSNRMENECSKAEHYYFGLRAVKYILKNTNDNSDTKIDECNTDNDDNDSKIDNDDTNDSNSDNKTLPSDNNTINNGDIYYLNNLINFYMASLLEKDKSIFRILLEEIYSSNITKSNNYTFDSNTIMPIH